MPLELLLCGQMHGHHSVPNTTRHPPHDKPGLVNPFLSHLHPGDQAELVFDLKEDRVERQLVGLLVEAGQGRPGLCQQTGVPCALLLQR